MTKTPSPSPELIAILEQACRRPWSTASQLSASPAKLAAIVRAGHLNSARNSGLTRGERRQFWKEYEISAAGLSLLHASLRSAAPADPGAATATGAASASRPSPAPKAPPAGKHWKRKAVAVASGIEGLIRERRPEARPVRSPDGRGIDHALFLATAIQDPDGEVRDEPKACRWLGYLQAMLVYEGVSDLQAEKGRNRDTRLVA